MWISFVLGGDVSMFIVVDDATCGRASCVMISVVSKIIFSGFTPEGSAIVAAVATIFAEVLVASDASKAHAFLVVSCTLHAGECLSFGEDFLFLGGQSLSLSD